MFVSINYFAWM